MEPVQFTHDVGTFTYKGTAGDDTINIHKVVGGVGSVRMEITGTGETVQFANPSDALVVEGQDGADTITVQSLDADFAADLKVYGRDGGAPHLVDNLGYDSVNFAGSISTNGGYLEAFAESISVASGVTLSAEDPTDPDGADFIVFRARRIGTAEIENLTPVGGISKTVAIDIGANATLEGAGVYLIAQA
jgi:hypothetical protein